MPEFCLRLVSLLLHLLIICWSTQACSPPFQTRLASCVYIGTNQSISGWCDAASRCQSIGGELIMDLDGIRDVNHWVDFYYIGVTDLLIERQTSRDNWRFANGSVFPTLTNDDWMAGLPNDNSVDDDFLAVSVNGLRDRPVNGDNSFVCQRIATPNSERMLSVDFLKLGNITPTYCYTDADVNSELQCLWLCVQRWECRAALFNRGTRACRMLDFTDSSVGSVIENDPLWVKYVKSYW